MNININKLLRLFIYIATVLICASNVQAYKEATHISINDKILESKFVVLNDILKKGWV